MPLDEQDSSYSTPATQQLGKKKRGGFLGLLGRVGKGLLKASPKIARAGAIAADVFGESGPLQRMRQDDEIQYRRGREESAWDRQTRMDKMAAEDRESERAWREEQRGEMRRKAALEPRDFEEMVRRTTELSRAGRKSEGPEVTTDADTDYELERPAGSQAGTPFKRREQEIERPLGPPPITGHLFGEPAKTERRPIKKYVKPDTSFSEAELSMLAAQGNLHAKVALGELQKNKLARSAATGSGLLRVPSPTGGDTLVHKREGLRIPEAPIRPTANERKVAMSSAAEELITENPSWRRHWKGWADTLKDPPDELNERADYEKFRKALLERRDVILRREPNPPPNR